jgi:general secretion pathway protein I
MKVRGFTLIEVLVALAIVVIGMSALLGAMTSAADTSIYLRDKMFAEWVALNRVEEVRLQFRKPAKGKSDGEVEYAGRKWRWEQEVLETEIPGILRVEVKVRPADMSASAKRSWYTTTSGIVGDAIAPPTGDLSKFRRPTGEAGPGGDGQGGDQEQNPDENPPPDPNPEPDPGTPPEGEPPAPEGGE